MKNLCLVSLFVLSTFQVVAQFAPSQLVSTASLGAKFVKSADMDGDSDNDLVLSSGADLLLCRNDGSGTFDPPKTIVQNFDDVAHFHLADLDADGKNDVISVAGDPISEVCWFKNLGNDKFSAKKTLHSEGFGGQIWERIHMADIDNDNDLDIFVGIGEDIGAELMWMEHLANDSFSAPRYFSHIGRSTETVDLDGDGDLDLLTEFYTEQDAGYRGFQWFENDGANDFTRQYEATSGGRFRDDPTIMTAKAMDFDMDGDLDVMVISARDYFEVGVFYNDGKGSFSNIDVLYISKSIGYFRRMTPFEYLDIDGDGDEDIAIGLNSVDGVKWFENDQGKALIYRGDKWASDALLYTTFLASSCDIDGDGDIDLIASTTGGLKWYENLFKSKYQLKGTIFYDLNKDGIQDPTEHGMNLTKVQLSTTSIGNYTSPQGAYFFAVNPGTYTVQSSTTDLWKRSSDSSTYTRTLSDTNPLEDGLNFGFYPRKIVTKIRPRLIGSFPRCNLEVTYWAHLKNMGTTTPSGLVHLRLHDSIKYVSSKIIPDSVKGQDIFWSYADLLPTNDRLFKLKVKLPQMNSRTEWLKSTLKVYELDAGKIVYTDETSMGQSLRCAYDPNDKSVFPLGEGPLGLVEKDEPLEYLIRFQNTGNDTAFNVMIRDHLDADLDLNTIEPLASSHPMEMWIEKDGEVVFKFADILLPDSNVNEEESHGFVSFSAQPKKLLAPLTTISSPANIYFDYNPPIITNSVINTVNCYLLPEPVVEWNPPYLESSLKGGYDYQWYFNGDTLKEDTLESIRPFQKGEYSVKVTDRYTCNKRSEAYSFTPTGISTLNGMGATIYPNPFSETTSIWFSKELSGGQLVFFDALGRKVYGIEGVQGKNVTVNANDLGKGLFMVYYLSATGKEKSLIGRVIAE